MQQIHIFDFDGTLTTRDTMIALIRYAKGNAKCFWGFLIHAPILILMKLHAYPNGRAKERLFKYFFGGTPVARFNHLCEQFAQSHRHLMRKQAVELLNTLARQDNTRIFVVSASIDYWVKPFFRQLHLDQVEVFGTRIEIKDGIVTGRLSGKNCYGPEKAERLKPLLPPRHTCHLTAYGDSRGDREMLNLADRKYEKPFR